jgi:hypothetical protein
MWKNLLEVLKADVDEDLEVKYPIKSALFRATNNVLKVLLYKKIAIHRWKLSLSVTSCE